MDEMISFGGNLFRVSSTVVTSIWRGFEKMATIDPQQSASKLIGTHSGVMHCDEALACFMLKQLPEYKEAQIIRSRDKKVLDECNIVVDVGGTYNPKIHRYDHHQREFNETFSSVLPELTKNKFNNIRLSSAGLIYAHFGLKVIEQILSKKNLIPTTECLTRLYLYVYENFIEELDAIDNGIPMYAEGKPKYRINTHLSARVGRLNPEWNEPPAADTNKLFEKAMIMSGTEFTQHILDGFRIWWPARELVKQSILNRKEVHPSGEIICLNGRCSWKTHLYDLEEEMGIVDEIKFCVFHESSADTWRVQGIPVQPDSFICRVFLHNDWRGVRDEELSEIAGIEGSIFVHSTGFIGGNKTKAGALQMAIKSLEAALINKE